MNYFSSERILQAYQNNAKTTDSKFWGLLGILVAIKQRIVPSVTYAFNTGITSQFLEDLFCLGSKKDFTNIKTKFYATFSNVWIEKAKSQMLRPSVDFTDVAVWFFRNESFSEKPSLDELYSLFSQRTGMTIDEINEFFKYGTELKDYDFSTEKTEDSAILKTLNTRYSNEKGYFSITSEGSFIKANPGEFSRAPFIQTLYASQQTSECLFLTQFPIPDYYTLNSCMNSNSPKLSNDDPLQQIFFGAPGTGKSHSIKEVCKAYEHYRITFHPDTDYASFVGAYKPTTKEVIVRDMSGHPIREDGKVLMEDKISYQFVKQAFLKAYIASWKEQQNDNPKPVFLVIEEINRGNCAQIFGDIFQLLDRNEEGFSDYPIHADTDLSKEVAKDFKDLNVANADSINLIYDGKDVVDEVKNGSHLLLPNNLYIWATMNTSDQSLFPIDSAFKRRWDWKYIKIADCGMGYSIAVNGKEYDWWEFLKAINNHIGTTTSQEDKKLGYFFAKTVKNADGKYVISADKFLSKVLFFLYGDVYKDFGFDDDIFKGDDGKPMEFSDYFDKSGNAIESNIEKFLMNLELKPKPKEEIPEDIEDAEIIESDTDDNKSSRKLSVEFPNGIIIKESTHFGTYLKTLENIGLDKVLKIAAQKVYVRKDEPLISKIQSPAILEDPGYSYVEIDGYYIVKGIDTRTQINFLNLVSQRLELNLNVKLE